MARNLKAMSDATLAANAVSAKRAANNAVAEYDAIAAEIKARATFGTVETTEGKVTLSDPYTRTDFDTAKAKVLIPDWEATCSKATNVSASVRVTFR
jgi:hypothetical protein